MKRILFILLATLSTAVCSAGTNAMSNIKVRKETRFLTDKMAYELNLSTEQYNDVYEINYDFISGVRYVMDDVLYGNEWALNRYYDYLDVRNDDLRWVLSSRQYARFMQAEYFYQWKPLVLPCLYHVYQPQSFLFPSSVSLPYVCRRALSHAS